jgi:cytochrome d ubiquinol oxidase subunit II
MSNLWEFLPELSAAAIAFTIITYVVLDGTDLGVGILYATGRNAEQRQIMINSILPIWDANETWLVLGGGGLLALFPAAYSVLFSALYMPVITLLLVLVFRAASLEFRPKVGPIMKPWLDRTFIASSVLATFCQGVIMGAVMQGIAQNDGAFTGTGWEWTSAFAIACGFGLVVGYALLGSCWLFWRTEGRLQQRAHRQARVLGGLTLLVIAIIGAWTMTLNPLYAEHLTSPSIIGPILLLQALLIIAFGLAFSTRYPFLPLFAALGWFAVAFFVAIVTLYPLIVPASLTIREASSPPLSQSFMLIGFAVLVPVTLAYNTWSFWVFRGKVHAD